MREVDAQAVLLVAAFEEADEEGRLLSPRERERATAAARDAQGDDPGRLLPDRAGRLLTRLEEQLPGVQGLLSASRLGAGQGTLVVLVTLALGLASHAAGPEGRIHVLFAPLLLLVLWNLFIYGLLPWLAWRRRRARAALGASVTGALQAGVRGGVGLLGRLGEWLLDRAPTRWRGRQVKHKAVVGAAVGRFLASWRGVALPLAEQRLARLLHLGAAGLAAGAVTGLYIRGLGLRYAATWDSTFLEAGTVQALLDVVLAPAAWLSGIAVPAVEPLRGAEGQAAPWIHLYALTALVVVLLPRLVLATLAGRRAAVLAADLPLPLDLPGLRRVTGPPAGHCAGVDVLPYSLHPDARSRDTLLALLHDHFGSRCEVTVADTVDYGDDPPRRATSPGRCTVLLLSLAQSPEVEVHGRLAADLAAGLDEDARLLVVLDASRFLRRLGQATGRLAERRRAWDRVLREVGLSALHVDLDRPPADDALERLAAALHPERPAASA